jgi:hypothetical protein
MLGRKLTLSLLLASVLALWLIVAGCGTGNEASKSTASSKQNAKYCMKVVGQTVDWIDLPLNGQAHADIVVYGKVTKIDPGQWNSPDGKYWEPDLSETVGVIYRTYYVEPNEVLKGTPKWGTPVAFIIKGGTEGETIGPVSVGDTVLVLGADYASKDKYQKAYWTKDAYFSLYGDTTVFVQHDDTLVKAIYVSEEGKVQEAVDADRGGTVKLETMRQAIAATKEGKSVKWYGDLTTTTTEPRSAE